MKPTQYYRLNKTWEKWLGKTGTVVSATYLYTSGDEFAKQVPYSLVIVEIERKRKMLMGAGHEKLNIGDKVECVLRLIPPTSESEILEYRIKVKKI